MKSISLLCVAAILGLAPICQAQSWSLEYGTEEGKVAYFNSKNTPDFAEDAPYGPLAFRVYGDKLWVLDSIAGKLTQFDNAGKALKTIVVPGLEGFKLLEDFALDGDDPNNPDAVWIANAADVLVRKISVADGKVLYQLEGNGTEEGKFGQIHQLETDAGGRVYVADIAKNKISVFSATGTFQREYIWQNSGLFVDKYANLHQLYYTEKSGYSHQVFSSKGQLISNTHLGFNKNTNAKIINVEDNGSIIMSMVPEEGFKGVLNIVKVNKFGSVLETAEFILPSSMNRYIDVNEGRLFVAEADFETAPDTKFFVKPQKWAEKKAPAANNEGAKNE